MRSEIVIYGYIFCTHRLDVSVNEISLTYWLWIEYLCHSINIMSLVLVWQIWQYKLEFKILSLISLTFNQDVDNQSTSDEFSGGGLLSDDSSSDSSSSDSDDDRGLQLRAPKLRSSQLHHRGSRREVVDSHHGTSKLAGHKPRLTSRAMSSSSDVSAGRRPKRNETSTQKQGGHSTGGGR